MSNSLPTVQESSGLKRKELTMQAKIQGGRASWMKRPSNNRRFFTHRYVSYPHGDLEGWVIRVKVGEDGSGLSVYPLHGDL